MQTTGACAFSRLQLRRRRGQQSRKAQSQQYPRAEERFHPAGTGFRQRKVGIAQRGVTMEGAMAINTLTQAKRVVKIVFAFTVLLAGIAMLVLPGPGLLVILGALAILSGEFVWARRLMERLKAGARRAQEAVTNRRAPNQSQ
jgi:hypothetical protein